MVLALSAVALPVAVQPGSAFDGFDNYTYGTSNCTGPKDPVNLYFEGAVGPVLQALAVTEGQPLEWPFSPIASNQWLWDAGAGAPGEICHVQDHQRSPYLTGNKHHVRLRDGSWVQYVGWVTAAPMHHDSLVLCGDVADSFNSARDYAKNAFVAAGGFVATRTWVGNTMRMRQCDGRDTWSDGYIYRIDH